MRRALLLALVIAVGLLAWWVWPSTPPPPPFPPFGPNANKFDCATLTMEKPLPDVEPQTRAAILEVLRKACQEK